MTVFFSLPNSKILYSRSKYFNTEIFLIMKTNKFTAVLSYTAIFSLRGSVYPYKRNPLFLQSRENQL